MGSAIRESKYSIPPQYQHLLELVDAEAIDTRSDDEILKQLCQHVPISSEKNIWAFWDSGLMSSELKL